MLFSTLITICNKILTYHCFVGVSFYTLKYHEILTPIILSFVGWKSLIFSVCEDFILSLIFKWLPVDNSEMM